jgi:hypothetical protein
MDAATDSASVVMLGMPDTGKSSFLASLFVALEGQRVKTDLRLASYSGDRTYVNRLAKRMRDLESLDHTQFGAEGELTLELEDDTARRFRMTIPDHSGETLERALTRRSLPERVAKALEECQGLILFLHPDAVSPSARVADAEKIIAALGGPESQPPEGSPKDWSNKHACTDVQMVDALQEVAARAGKIRLSVVVSAWDVAARAADTPDSWLAKELPLLTQFLSNNPDRFTSRIFGVSAQGGDYEVDREELAGKEVSARTIVIGDGCEPHDLSAVISWILRESPSDPE